MGDPFSAGATAATKAGDWLLAAKERARKKDAQAAAHLIEQAGLMAVELRNLLDALNDLLYPLTRFAPEDWPPDRRTAWRKQAELFDRGDDSIYKIQSHAGKLNQLRAPTTQAIELRTLLVGLGEETMHMHQGEPRPDEISQRVKDLPWQQDVEPYRQLGASKYGQALYYGGPDLLIRNYMPALMWLVANANTEAEVQALQRMASALLVTRTHDDDKPLRQVVDAANEAFASLTGHLLSRYPEIPEPDWARLG